MTNLQVTQQQQRFDQLISNNDFLIKIALKTIRMDIKGDLSSHTLISRYLRLNNIKGAMIHPISREFYGTLLNNLAVIAFFKNLKEN
jgi:hypothetical protein